MSELIIIEVFLTIMLILLAITGCCGVVILILETINYIKQNNKK